MSLSWGGFANGSIPAADLHEVPQFKPLADGWASAEHGSNVMRSDAAVQLSGLQAAFFLAFGIVLYVREAYRSVDGQNFYYNRMLNKLPGWTLAAYPRTSIHGWALSVDLGVGEENANPSGEYLDWLRAHAAEFGFRNDVPTESWHWSFLLAPLSVVSAYIANPSALGAGTPPSPEEDMGIRLIRNNTKGDADFGSVDAVCVETGFYRHLGTSGVTRFEKAYGIESENLSAEDWGYWIGVAKDHRKLVAKTAANLYPYPTPLTADDMWKNHRLGDGAHSADYWLTTAGATAEAISGGKGMALDSLLDAIADRVAKRVLPED